MFDKILIANRGEIACRVIKTCKRLGIKTVAVYSEADADALHVEMADEAVLVGPPAPGESYLVIDRIVAACRDTGAQAVHPGYGFLSENAQFAEALDAAGIVFIGPGRKAIQAMGDKIESKKLADAAKVSTVPGYLGVIEGPEEAVKIADDIGYPVMIKASAGGGGKGMRVAWNAEEAAEGFRLAQNEARTSFGDDRVFLEKFVQEPRHIEIQVLADGHGNCIYLGERECSIQRRHQKVIEEAPSPFLDEETRSAMGEQAVALAKAVEYRSAGTVEFIVDADRNFYFLEMNTRLQVEHPVTELITGIDLVEQMIRVAAGDKLTIGQKDVQLNGWAFESRIYAEDPYRGFLPSTGRVTRFRPPAEENGVRIDTGVVEGSEISLYYDPMVAKLCAYGADREQAAECMVAALNGLELDGISHNVNFLAAVFAHPRFREGRLSTAFIDDEYADGFSGAPLDAKARRGLAAIAAMVHLRSQVRQHSISDQVPNYKPVDRSEWSITLDGEAVSAEVTAASDDFSVVVDGAATRVQSDWRPGTRLFRGTVDGEPMLVQIRPNGGGFLLTHGGADVAAVVRRPRAAELAALMPLKEPPDMSKFLLCPMPGLVVSIDVEPGQNVEPGMPLAVVEAMKMENVLRAEAAGVVAEVRAKPGDSLALDDVILSFE